MLLYVARQIEKGCIHVGPPWEALLDWSCLPSAYGMQFSYDKKFA